jgi:hypothetical protein
MVVFSFGMIDVCNEVESALSFAWEVPGRAAEQVSDYSQVSFSGPAAAGKNCPPCDGTRGKSLHGALTQSLSFALGTQSGLLTGSTIHTRDL